MSKILDNLRSANLPDGDVPEDFSRPAPTDTSPKCATILVQRRLDDALSGSGVYLFALIDMLAACGYAVRIVCAPTAGFGSIPLSRPAAAFSERNCEIHWPRSLRIGQTYVALSGAVWLRAFRRGSRLLAWALLERHRKPRPRFTNTLGSPPAPADHRALARTENAAASTVTIAEYSSMGPVLSDCIGRTKAVLLHDVFSLRADSFREAELSPDHVSIPMATELGWLKEADLCIYASAAEAKRLSQELPDKRHIWLPPSVHVVKAAGSGTPRAVFIGVRHGGNRDALEYLLDEIWPLVRAALPSAELLIVGEIGNDVHEPPAGVTVLGRIEDLTQVGGAASVGLAPARAASGASIKLVTYMELGMSVLASSKALEGYDGALDPLVVKADSAREFSENLVRLLSDHAYRETLAQRCSEQIAASIHDTELARYLNGLPAPEAPATAGTPDRPAERSRS